MEEFYRIMFMDQDGELHEEHYHDYNIAKSYAKIRSRDFGEATLIGDYFGELWIDGEFCKIQYAAIEADLTTICTVY